ncbi:hypothetical protein MTAT_16960 [Moorella thermoacetica]|uniref:Uncharacterized protein n=1 Tax=Neomoorella thermoacetica TaxID=1525 RepID=A0AAC9HFP8_NEOTH|nr:hypothetical protein [Moorella thermoacetica]AOQ23166.1 hypothetical protein Maut_00703 [Moorella thermoacetica]TYL12873.1 hypothetical protein MTAT_16960 [Moorella thermoacetica]
MQDILALCDLAIDVIRKKKEIFARLEREPELILTDLFNPSLSHPYYELPFRTIEHSEELGLQRMYYHQMQERLAGIIACYFNKLDADVIISLKNKNFYPSSCIVYFQDYPIAEFDFYRHTFKDLRKEYAENLERNFEYASKTTKETKEEFDKWTKWHSDPASMLDGGGWCEKLFFLFHRKQIMAGARSKAEAARARLTLDEEMAAKAGDKLRKYKEVQQELKRKYDFWEGYFVGKLGYRKSGQQQ